MNSETYRSLVSNYWEQVWNQKNYDVIDELFDSQSVLHYRDLNVPNSKQKMGIQQNWHRVFPDLHVSVRDMIIEDDKVVSRLVFHGTHQADGFGSSASGKTVEFTEIIIFRFEGDKIIEAWEDWDELGMLRQIGTIP